MSGEVGDPGVEPGEERRPFDGSIRRLAAIHYNE